MKHIVCSKKGITVLETLIVIGILVIVGAIGFGTYRNYSKNVELESTANMIVSDFKSMRSKAINGEDDLKWGIHFVNDTNDYYEVFSTATDYTGASVKRTVYLPNRISFSVPGEGASKDFIFNKIRGTLDVQETVTLVFESSTRIITVTTLGNIY